MKAEIRTTAKDTFPPTINVDFASMKLGNGFAIVRTMLEDGITIHCPEDIFVERISPKQILVRIKRDYESKDRIII